MQLIICEHLLSLLLDFICLFHLLPLSCGFSYTAASFILTVNASSGSVEDEPSLLSPSKSVVAI